jgi:hypothetical protein
MSEDLAKRVEQYIQVRDAIKRLDEKWEKEKAPLLEIQQILSGKLEAALDASNAVNIKTEAGTFYKSTRYTASLADPDAFMNFVKQYDKFELLDRRANATAVRDYVAKSHQLPPGCNLSAIQSIGVRRKAGSGSTPEAAE